MLLKLPFSEFTQSVSLFNDCFLHITIWFCTFLQCKEDRLCSPVTKCSIKQSMIECILFHLAVQFSFTSNTVIAKHGANTPWVVGTSTLPPNTIVHNSSLSRLRAPPASQTPPASNTNTLHNPQSRLQIPFSMHLMTSCPLSREHTNSKANKI